MRDNLIPILFFLFMVLNIYLDRTKRKKRRQKERDKQQNEAECEPEILAEPAPEQKKPNDLAAEFERRLKKTTQAAEAAKAREQGRVVTDGANVRHDDAGVVHDDKNRVRRDSEPKRSYKRVHTDTEAQHEMHGRVHRDKEAFAHDKGKVYYDPRGDYSYDEAKMNAAAAAFNARYAQEEPVRKLRVHLKHKALVQGFIMSEVLAKPRALKPYEEDVR